MNVITVCPAPEDGGGDKTADQRGHDADEDRHDNADVLAARYEQSGQRANHKSDEKPDDDDGKL